MAKKNTTFFNNNDQSQENGGRNTRHLLRTVYIYFFIGNENRIRERQKKERLHICVFAFLHNR